MAGACAYCGGEPGSEFSTREMMIGLRDEFTYQRCATCRSLWISEVPSDLARYYDGLYYSLGVDPKGATPIRGAELWAQALLRLPSPVVDLLAGRRGFPRYLRWLRDTDVSLASRILDVGCGAGNLVLQMSRHGFTNLWGVDPYIQDRDQAKAHLRRGTIRSINEGSFELVMFNHSLEHVADPIADLRCAAERLASGGHILVRIPVADSWADHHFGPNWVSLDPPRHLTVPSRTGMVTAASSIGLRIVRTFFDSTTLQFTGSEGYARGVPLREQTPSVTRDTEQRVRQLNRDGAGDMAGFVLERGGG